jgi:hypothetical protein
MNAKDRLVAKRRHLPVAEVDRNYKFTGTNGDRDLLVLFEGRRQLVAYRFFHAPDVGNSPDGACSGCSLFADTVVHPNAGNSLRPTQPVTDRETYISRPTLCLSPESRRPRGDNAQACFETEQAVGSSVAEPRGSQSRTPLELIARGFVAGAAIVRLVELIEEAFE